jgi:hypothetical protein
MTFENYYKSVTNDIIPDVNYYLKALWYDKKGDWNKAHEIVQDIRDGDASWVHAYLHRKEGDLSNASFWYHRAGKPVPSLSLEEEWESLSRHFLNDGKL